MSHLEPPTEPRKIFIQSREQFTCLGKQDGFYASRWCNVFYRCVTGISSAFLCPKMPNGARLWWVQHDSPQSVAQETASCTWPCETGRRCSAPGGIIIDSDTTISESPFEAGRIYNQSLCTTVTRPDGTVSQVAAGPGSSAIESTNSTREYQPCMIDRCYPRYVHG
jgi:hypothetical protein